MSLKGEQCERTYAIGEAVSAPGRLPASLEERRDTGDEGSADCCAEPGGRVTESCSGMGRQFLICPRSWMTSAIEPGSPAPIDCLGVVSR